MNVEFLKYLADPDTGAELELIDAAYDGQRVHSGILKSPTNQFPIVDGVPRFVEHQAYTNSFGFEWTRWPRLQFDSENIGKAMEGYSTRMWEQVTCHTDNLKNQLVVDVGCGPGRFIEVARQKQGRVIGIDYSLAVDAAYQNFLHDPEVLICQADALKLPLKPGIVNASFSIGVLHHLPEPVKGLAEMTRILAPEGWTSICVYEKSGYYNYPNVQLWRAIFAYLAKVFGYYPALLYSFCTVYGLRFLDWVPSLRKLVKIFFPYISLPDIRWSILDTFDSITPQHQSAHTTEEVQRWFVDTGLSSIKQTPWGSTAFKGYRRT
ncbi:class I SAM-dependent methyltransferase [Oligoflexia bacterium]|nr:class I SAM-dependent methyltransferase [Oligoflexia bacterium]